MRGAEAVELAELRRQMVDGSAKRLRQASGLGLTELGQVANIDTSTIWRWENGKQRPSGVAALRYARVLRLLSQRSEAAR